MRPFCVAAVMAAALSLTLIVGGIARAQNAAADSPAAAQAAGNAAHEAIEASVARFVTAFNAHDPAALAALFLPEAQIVDDSDFTVQGRADIEALYTDVFAERPEATIEVDVHSIRLVGSALAVEKGATSTIPAPGAAVEQGRYTAIHVLRDGQWLLGVVQETTDETLASEQLQELAWMVGDWIDENRDGTVHTSCRWDENGNYLLQDITVRQAGEPVMTINQRIGWDPLTKNFKSWMFDSEGGYGEGAWTPTESGWLIKARNVQSDGSIGSATNLLEPEGPDRYRLRSADRVAGGEVLPPVDVVIVRQPPKPTQP